MSISFIFRFSFVVIMIPAFIFAIGTGVWLLTAVAAFFAWVFVALVGVLVQVLMDDLFQALRDFCQSVQTPAPAAPPTEGADDERRSWH